MDHSPDTRSSHYYYSRAVTGLVVVIVGVLFLLRNFGVPLPFWDLHNWWALFILLGAVPPLGYALARLRQVGRLDAGVLHGFLSAAVVVMVALIFLLDLSWERWWPLFVIYGGLWMMVRGERRWRRDD